MKKKKLPVETNETEVKKIRAAALLKKKAEKKANDIAEARAPLNDVCEKCGKIYCDHEFKY